MTLTFDHANTVAVPSPSSYAGSFLRDDLTWQAAGGFPPGAVIDIDVGSLIWDIDVIPPSLVTD